MICLFHLLAFWFIGFNIKFLASGICRLCPQLGFSRNLPQAQIPVKRKKETMEKLSSLCMVKKVIEMYTYQLFPFLLRFCVRYKTFHFTPALEECRSVYCSLQTTNLLHALTCAPSILKLKSYVISSVHRMFVVILKIVNPYPLC